MFFCTFPVFISSGLSTLSMTINNFRSSDVGKYSCTAENLNRKLTREVFVALKAPCQLSCTFDYVGNIPHPTKCSNYYLCSANGYTHYLNCPAGQTFDIVTSECADAGESLCYDPSFCL